MLLEEYIESILNRFWYLEEFKLFADSIFFIEDESDGVVFLNLVNCGILGVEYSQLCFFQKQYEFGRAHQFGLVDEQRLWLDLLYIVFIEQYLIVGF